MGFQLLRRSSRGWKDTPYFREFLGSIVSVEDGLEDFAKREHADGNGDEVESAVKDGNAEGEALGSRYLVDPDGGQKEAGDEHDEGLGHRFSGKSRYGGKSEHDEGEILGRAEFEGDFGEGLGEDGQHDQGGRAPR